MKTSFDLTNIYEKYKGLWVAFDEKLKKVVSADANAKKTYEKALKKGVKNPTLFRVPKQNSAYFGTSFYETA